MDNSIAFEKMMVPNNLEYYRKFFETFDNFTLEMLEFNKACDSHFTKTIIDILQKEEIDKPVLSLVYDNKYIVSVFSLSGNIIVSSFIQDSESEFIVTSKEAFRSRMLEFIDIIENQMKDKTDEEAM